MERGDSGRPVTPRPLMSRRTLLKSISAAGVGGLALSSSACTPSTGNHRVRRQTPATSSSLRGDAALVSAALAGEQRLLEYCTALLARHPQLGELVTPVLRRQRRHVETLQSSLRGTDPHASPSRLAVPGSEGPAIAKLSQLAGDARAHRFEDCLAASSGRLARLLASTSAAHAVTVEILEASR